MISGVILAGGARDKIDGVYPEFLRIGSESILTRQISEMQSLCDETIIVTDEPRTYLEFVPRSVRIITDFYGGSGPLGGLHAAFALAKHPSLWVTAQGMPFVSAPLAKLLHEHMNAFGHDAVMPRQDGRLQPWHGLYRQACLEDIVALLEAGERSWKALFDRISWDVLDETLWHGLGQGSCCTLRIRNAEDYGKAVILQQTYVDNRPNSTSGRA